MDTFWNVAISLLGIGAVGSFVLFGIYRKWLNVAGTVFAKLNSKQTYWLLLSSLVLTFIFAMTSVLVFAFSNSTLMDETSRGMHKIQRQKIGDTVHKKIDWSELGNGDSN